MDVNYHASVERRPRVLRNQWRRCIQQLLETWVSGPKLLIGLGEPLIVGFNLSDGRPRASTTAIVLLRGEILLNHRPEVYGGVLEAECAVVLREFFRLLPPPAG